MLPERKSYLFKLLFVLSFACYAAVVFSQVGETQSLDGTAGDLSLLQQIELWYVNNMNYFAIALLMALESSFLGIIPSELIVSVAAYVALSPDAPISFWGVVLSSTIGSLVGGFINYSIAIGVGRKMIYAFADTKTGHFFMLSKLKLEKAEKWFVKYSKISVCIGRIVPAVRQFISIPAGLAKMNVFTFAFYTFVGSGVWNTVLALLGYLLHGQQELIKKYTHELSYAIVVVLSIFVVFLIIRSIINKRKKNRTLRHFGLVGYPLGHSFSKKYFTDKFKKEKINAVYNIYPYKIIDEIKETIENDKQLEGFNVTIPYKEAIIPLLNEMNEVALKVGAVNVVKITRGDTGEVKLKGYNTDVFGFEESIKPYLNKDIQQALVLGTGGAAKAIVYSLQKMGITVNLVSRTKSTHALSYDEIDEKIIAANRLIINATPLGMHPNEGQCADIPYWAIQSNHILFDVIYNPEETLFLRKGRERQARTINGSKMLIEQARAAWRIWNDNNA